MGFLLDTHVMLWWLADSPLLPPGVGAVIADPQNDVAYSVIGVWEIAIKASIGKLAEGLGVREALLAQGFAELPVLGEHAEAVRHLPWRHRDPFDRMLVAQAIVEERVLITADERLATYDVEVLAP